jgi:hypothetical protein
MNKKEKILFEKLASIQHKIWGSWQKYLHSKCTKTKKGLLIPMADVKRWEHQINTPYSKLSKEEKNGDREQANKYISLISKLFKK